MSEERNKYAKDIASQFSDVGLRIPADAPDSVPQDYSKEIAAGVSGYAPKPGSVPVPVFQAPPSLGVPYRNAMSQDDINAANNQAKDERNGLNVAAYNSQRRAYDQSQGLPVTPPQQGGGGVVRAVPQQQARPAPTPVGGQGPSFGAMGKTYDAEMAAQRDVANAGVTANEAQSTGNAMLGDQQRRDAEAQQAHAAEQAKQTQSQIGEIQRLSDEAAKKGVDPERWWHSQDGGHKAMYTIAAALGGFAAGWTHGPNQVMGQINRYIDDDIGAQKTAIEQAHGRVTDAKGVLGEMYQRFGNLNQAEAASRILHYDAMSNDVKAQVASAQSPAIAANGKILEAELQRKKLEAQQRFMAAGAQKGLDFGALHTLSKDLEGNRSAAADAALANLRKYDPGGTGDIPGSSVGGRLLANIAAPDEHGNRGFFGGIAQMARGADARQAEGAMYQLAEASLPPSMRGSPEAVKNQSNSLFGSKTPEEIKSGIERAQALVEAQKVNAYAGQRPETVQAYEALNSAYGRRSAPKPGLPPGSTGF